MAVDVRRMTIAAVEAAFDQYEQAQEKRRRRLPAARALLVGAAVATAARVAWGSRGQGLLDSLEERLGGLEGDRNQQDDDFDEQDDAEFDEPEAEEEPEFDEPEAEEEEPEEPEAYEDDEEDEEHEAEEGEYDDDEASSEDDYEDDDFDEQPDDEEEAPRRQAKAGSRSRRRS